MGFSSSQGDNFDFYSTGSQLFLRENGTNVALASDWNSTSNFPKQWNLTIDTNGNINLDRNNSLLISHTFSALQGVTGNDLNFSFSLYTRQEYIATHSTALSASEIQVVNQKANQGLEIWGQVDPSGWSAREASVTTSLNTVLATQASIGGAARTAELKSQIQQCMVDAIDTATARLVNKDIDRLGALRAAGEVREQLAQAMMQTQTNTLFAQTSMFSNALGLFDSMNIGGFRRMGLETTGKHDVKLPLGFSWPSANDWI